MNEPDFFFQQQETQEKNNFKITPIIKYV